MRLNSKLWMLAVALATVGCQDDLGNDANTGNDGTSGTGITTYMTVNVSTENTTTTKATGGEDGDGYEVPTSEDEYTVDDVTLVLFRNADNTAVSAIDESSVLIAAGYSDNVGEMSNSTETNHSWKTSTVTLSVTDDAEDFDGTTYGVIAITNLGSSDLANSVGSTITTGADLADYIQTSVINNIGGNSRFVMSSHYPTVERVTLVAGSTAESAPSTDVHVERMAAKIRINEYDENGFIYSISDGTDDVAKVRLDQVAIVNQLTSGTYMLKHVTETTTDLTLAGMPTSETYLGDEIWTEGSSAVTANYVIDPWTRIKTTGNLSDYGFSRGLSYDNHFAGDNYATMWGNLSVAADLATGSDEDKTENGGTAIRLCYTQENTTAAEYSLNGYSTGAIFKATYMPRYLTVVNGEGNGVETEDVDGYSNFDETATGIDFYVYDSKVYENMDAIWAEYLANHPEAAGSYTYSTFTSANITSLSIAEYKESSLYGTETAPLGYVEYLKDLADNVTSEYFDNTASIEYYLQNYSANAMGEQVKFYPGGEMYYPYWIRHADNNKSNEMGIMEFGIVRNNIYDLTVSGFSGLGFGKSPSDEPDPGTPDESEELFIKVNLYVKDWVLRSNDGILL